MSTLITVRVSPHPHYDEGKSINNNEGIIIWVLQYGYNEGESINICDALMTSSPNDVCMSAPRDSSSSAILNAPLAVPLHVEAPFDAQPSSTTATPSQHAVNGPHVPQQHLQRAPSDDENSDSDFDQFLRVLDSS